MAYEERIVQFNEDTVIGSLNDNEYDVCICNLKEPYRTMLMLALEMVAQAKTLDKE